MIALHQPILAAAAAPLQLGSVARPTLGWTPFLEPINIFHTWWYLLAIPLALGIALVYKALRVATFEKFAWQVIIMTIQIVLGMIAMAVALGLLVQYGIPALPAN